MAGRLRQPRWAHICIALGAALFIVALVVSAIYDPRIRVLHALQALIYVAVIVLTRRGSAWGFGAGFVMAAFWNYLNLFVTTFVRAGLTQLGILLTRGEMPRPDLFLAIPAAGGHFLLMAGCLAAFVRLRPRARDWLRCAGGGAVALLYFIAAVATTGQQFVPLLKRVFGL